MDKLKERSEVSASDKWQIEKIYKNIFRGQTSGVICPLY